MRVALFSSMSCLQSSSALLRAAIALSVSLLNSPLCDHSTNYWSILSWWNGVISLRMPLWIFLARPFGAFPLGYVPGVALRGHGACVCMFSITRSCLTVLQNAQCIDSCSCAQCGGSARPPSLPAGKVNSRHLVDVSGSPCGFVRAHQLSSGAQGLFSGLSDVLFSEVPSHVFLKNV